MLLYIFTSLTVNNNCSAEKSILCLKKAKNYLRSTVTHQMNASAILKTKLPANYYSKK